MAAMSDTLETSFLDHVTGNAAYSAPSAVYLGLTTSSGGFADGGTGTEVVGNGYQRQAITFGASSASSIASNAAVTFPRSTAAQGTVHGWGIFSAQTGGDLLYHGMFSSSRAVLVDESFYVASGAISLTPSGAMQGYAFQNWSNLVLRGTSWAMPTSLYMALDRTGATIGPASASFTVLGGGTFDEPRWHDWSTGTVTHNSTGTADQQNAKRRAGVVNGSAETFGGYQRCRLAYNAASNGSASLAYSVTRDDGLWDNTAARSGNWDSTNSRRQNWGKTELRTWTDRVEFPIAGNDYPVVGAETTPPSGSGVGYTTIIGWAVVTGLGVVTGSYTPTSGKNYGEITGWGIFDAETPQTGNLLFRGAFPSAISATDLYDVVRIPASNMALVAA